MESINLTLPVVLMNGVLIYDPAAGQYIKAETIPEEAALEIIKIKRQTGQSGFMYTLNAGRMATYYEPPATDIMRRFIDERVRKFNKPFTCADLTTGAQGVIYFCFIDRFENVQKIHSLIKNIDGISSTCYRDIYSNDDWYLEIFSAEASKATAVNFLRHRYNFDKIIGFGDNLNDISFFSVCDECYATANAADELKAISTAVIGSNEQDGVAKWLSENVLSP